MSDSPAASPGTTSAGTASPGTEPRAQDAPAKALATPPSRPAGWLARILFTLGLLADAALITLLIAVSGFVFGGGPEGLNGEVSAVLSWGAALSVCVLAPLIGITLWRRGRADLAVAAAWLPPLGLLVGAVIS